MSQMELDLERARVVGPRPKYTERPPKAEIMGDPTAFLGFDLTISCDDTGDLDLGHEGQGLHPTMTCPGSWTRSWGATGIGWGICPCACHGAPEGAGLPASLRTPEGGAS